MVSRRRKASHLAAGVGDRQRNTARVAGAGIDDHQRIAEAAAMGTVCFRHEMMSPLRSKMLLTATARRTAARRAGFNSVGISTDISDSELVAFQDHLDTILYSNYILLQVFIWEEILCTTMNTSMLFKSANDLVR